MSGLDMLYQPPEAATPAGTATLSPAEWRHVAKIFACWVIGASLLVGAVDCLQSGYALHHFDATHWAVRLVVVGALRAHGAGTAFSAAAVAFVALVHRRSTAKTAPPGRGLLLPLLAILPLTAPCAACVMIAAAVTTAALVFDVPMNASWTQLAAGASPEDPIAGAGAAMLLALVLGLTAPAAGRLIARMRGRLIVKVIIVLVATHVGTILLNTVWNAASPSKNDFTIPGMVGLVTAASPDISKRPC